MSNIRNYEGYIQFASVGRPHGLKGAFFLKTDDRRTSWPGYKSVCIQTPTGPITSQVVSTYLSGQALVLQLADFTNRTQIEPLYLCPLYVHRDEISPRSQDEWLVADLKGFAVRDESGKEWGVVVGVVDFGAQENLEIRLSPSGKMVYYPFIEPFVKKVDEAQKIIEIIYIQEFLEDT